MTAGQLKVVPEVTVQVTEFAAAPVTVNGAVVMVTFTVDVPEIFVLA